MTPSHQAVPLSTTNADAPLDDLEQLRAIVDDATVVGVARGAHGTTELTRISHRLVRYLITSLGFRTLAIEASSTATSDLDRWLRHGQGDPTAALREMDPWWRAVPFLDVLAGLRRINQRHPDDPVELLGVESTQPSMDALEHAMATMVSDAHSRSGHRIVYWSGSHSAVGHQRRVRWREEDPGDSGGRSAGSYLRERFGSRYRSLGLTFRQGATRLGDDEVNLPAAPPDYLCALLDPYGFALHTLRPGHELADAPLRYRLVGPFFDPDHPAEMYGGAASTFFDAVLHVPEVTSAELSENRAHHGGRS